MLIFYLIIFSFVFLLNIPADASDKDSSTTNKKVKIIPGIHYKSNWLHNIFFGKHWRDLWVTPIEAEVLDLKTFAGGIKPLKKGGGLQTKSLRFIGNDGREWKFRSIDKDPSKVLPADLQESLVSDVIQDQISSANPLAPIIVVPLLNEVGVLQVEPKIVLLPDTDELGEFREEFGNMAGMIELHPKADKDEEEIAFEDAEKVESTFDLLNRLAEKRDEKVDSKDFLKARLMDILFGDWDRHTDQWRWAKFPSGKNEIWKPIPRDRDQAFAKFDGIFPSIVSYYTPQLVHFDEDYPQIEDLTWNGRFLDRRFLSELTREDWDSVTSFVYSRMTDDVIENAVKLLPPEHYKIAGEEIIYKLQKRRDELPEISDEFYELVNEVVDIYGTDKDDYAEIIRINNEKTGISLYKKDDGTGEKKDKPLYHKVFDNYLTREIRIYLLDEDDKVVVKGEVESSPLIRIISGKGKDELIDSSKVKGKLLSFLPINIYGDKTGFYDSGKNTKFHINHNTFVDKYEVPEPKDDFEKYEPKQIDRSHDWLINPVIGYNSNDGLIIGGGPKLKSYNFRAEPYEYSMTLTGAYATNPETYRINFAGDFHSVIKNGVLLFDFLKSRLNLIQYYGYGNETPFSSYLERRDYYRLEQELLDLQSDIIFHLSKSIDAGVGLSYNYSTISVANKELLTNLPDSSYGIGTIHLVSASALFRFNSRDNESIPLSGFFLNAEADFTPKVLDNSENFVKASIDLRSYISAGIFSLALRAGGEKIWGNYPFMNAAFLGGADNLRGYSRERFSGDASLFGQSEIRIHLTKLKFIILGDLGINFFAETGRVFAQQEESDKWHPSFGGGAWISFLQKDVNLSFTIASSPETTIFYFGTKLGF